MTGTPSVKDAIVQVAGNFAGQFLAPSDAAYDEARKIHNGLIDKSPDLIARCRGRRRSRENACNGGCDPRRWPQRSGPSDR